MIQVRQSFGRADQQHLKQSVVQNDLFLDHSLKAADGHRVADHAEDKIVLQLSFVPDHLHMVLFQRGQTADAGQNVSCAAQHIFHGLGRCVGGLGKGAKSRHINKQASAVHPAHVTGLAVAGH